MFNFLSRGDLEIVLDKYQYTFGDTIKGKITLKLKKPTQANKISIELCGTKTTTVYNYGPNVQLSERENTNIQTIYDFTLPLDGAKEYTEAEYPFEIKTPTTNPDIQVNASANATGTLGQIAQTFATFENMTGKMNSKVTWYLEAQLDISGAIDMRKKVQISVM